MTDRFSFSRERQRHPRCQRVAGPLARYLRLERLAWARSDAAARLAVLEALFDRSVLPAADAALRPVTFLLPTWARSDAAARLAVLDALFDRSVLPAADAAFLPVCPDRAMLSPLACARSSSHLSPTDEGGHCVAARYSRGAETAGAVGAFVSVGHDLGGHRHCPCDRIANRRTRLRSLNDLAQLILSGVGSPPAGCAPGLRLDRDGRSHRLRERRGNRIRSPR